MEQFIPPTTIIVLYCAFTIFQLENKRWVRSISAGRHGSSGFVVLFVNITAFLALLLSIVALVLVFWHGGWQIGLGLMVISFVVGLISSMVIGVVMGGDSLLIQIVAVLGLWPLGYFLIKEILTSFPI